ncbi:hypothetical protein FDZ74_11385, partial [bacterium]
MKMGTPAYNRGMTTPVHGRLKLFLGYAPGVGKSNAMLDAALQRAQQGESVLVAAAGQDLPGDRADLLPALERIPLAGNGGLDLDTL